MLAGAIAMSAFLSRKVKGLSASMIIANLAFVLNPSSSSCAIAT